MCGIFVGNFFDGGTGPFLCVGARMSFHALVIDMVLAKGAGIPAPSDTIDVCVSKHQSALIEGMGIPAPHNDRGPQARV